MSQYRMTYFWNQSTMGVSESWYTPNLASASSASSQVQQWLALRTAMMYSNQFTVGVRVSVVGQKRSSVLLVPPYDIFPGTTALITIPTSGSIPSDGNPGTQAQLRAALQFRLTFDSNRTKLRYLAGIPVTIEGTEPATGQVVSDPGWFKAYTAWWQWMVATGWGILANQNSVVNPGFAVQGLVLSATTPSQVGIQVSSVLTPGIVVGQKIHLTGFRPAKGTRGPTINGYWYVSSVNTTLISGSTIYFLQNSSLVDPTQQRITGTSLITPFAQAVFPAQNITWVRVGIHKRGRPSIAPRGRRLSRPTLDP